MISELHQPIWRSATQLSELHDQLKGKHFTTFFLLCTSLLKSYYTPAIPLNFWTLRTGVLRILYSRPQRTSRTFGLMFYKSGLDYVALTSGMKTDVKLENERREIFQWVSKVRFKSHHRSIGSDILDYSGQWLRHKAEFIEWRKSSISSILWLHGIRKVPHRS